jgi:hypothetical protein
MKAPRAGSHEAARQLNKASQLMLDENHRLKRIAATKDGTRTFDNAPRNQYGPNAFDRLSGPRTTGS